MLQHTSLHAPKLDSSYKELTIAIVRSTYHGEMTQNMEKECKNFLVKSGVDEKNINTFFVPGSWEIPLVVKKLAITKKYDGIITFGVIVKGETYHFDMIANECARALMQISVECVIPITLEILAVYDILDAKKRSTGITNKGTEAAKSVLETIATLQKINL